MTTDDIGPGTGAGDDAPAVTPDLATVRAQIDGIDRHIQALIAKRARWARQVGQAKGLLAVAVDDSRPELKDFAGDVRVPGSFPVAVP
ncbi:hypothetical protein E4582_03305 [Luteimonas yindakuii]|uniref:chorismate mutase n=1 Tax=Luteimonas yindakuii TaxID=2565782 RepID=A0A4Z1R4Q4_9GAMM|nr:hypothetical protein E4582_03305 [Luteimonas yindakuii]